jgi:integrase/recombinase XerD
VIQNKEARPVGKDNFRSHLVRYDSMRPYLVRFIYNYHSEGTKKAYRSDLLDFLKWFSRRADSEPSKIKPSDVEEIHIIAWKNILLQKYSKRSINRKLAALSAFFRFLETDRAVISSPVNRVKRLPNPKEFSTRDLSDLEVKTGIENVLNSRNIRHIIVVYIFVYTGLRCSEAMSLTFNNIVNIDGENYFKVITKGSKERLIFINANLYEKIIDYRDYINASLIKKGAVDLSFVDDTYLIQSRVNLNFSKEIKENLKNLLKRCSITTVYLILEKYFGKGARPHQFRSTVIGHLIDKGISLNIIADFCGHADIKTTSAYYQRRISFKKNAGREIDWSGDLFN